MKNIIAGIATLVVLSLAFFTFSKGGAYHGGEHGKIIKDFENTNSTTKQEEVKKDKGMDELSTLRDKAGNVGSFKVSQKYKSKCASCHGANGSGYQNGRAMMGPKLYGQSEEQILKSLIEFQDGRKENIVMRGLLISMDRDELKEFAKEIGEFPARAEAVNNK
jgi:cytochrome c553